ncbi:MAG: EAL domain-containing protein, partial [Aquificae bacterium]|nr:EAL domain-containing protein [Aquificota bacterium]
LIDRLFKRFEEKGVEIHEFNTKIVIHPQINAVIIKKLDERATENATVSFKMMNPDKRYVIYEDEIKSIVEKENQILKILTNSLHTDGFIVPAFQKIQSIKDPDDYYYEALIRLVHEGRILMPADFLDIAKKHGLYQFLSKKMLYEAFKKAKEKGFKVSVNLDVLDLFRGDFLEDLEEIINKTKIDPKSVMLEFTETEDLYKILQTNNSIIDRLHSYGFELCIDDFGSGYSNFSYLADMPLKVIKIDGKLIKQITTNKRSYTLVKYITRYAKDMNIKTVAEYVSSQEILEAVKDIGIDYAQGFLISKPEFFP